MNNDALQTNEALQINDDTQSRSSSSLLPCDDAGNKKYQILNDMNNEAFQTDETLQMDDDTIYRNNSQPTTSSTKKIISRFVVFRLRIFNKRKCTTLNKYRYDSKSMAMHVK